MTDFNDSCDKRAAFATLADADWDEVRHGLESGPPTSTPSALALVESAPYVSATVRFAAANGLKVAGQGTGHCAAPLAPSRRVRS